MIGLYDKNNVLITNLIENAIASPDVIEVKNRTLDGKWHIQTIGEGCTIVKVKSHLRKEEKEKLDSIKRTSDIVKLIFDGKYYIGLIDDNIDYDRRKFAEHAMFASNFTLLVNEEGPI